MHENENFAPGMIFLPQKLSWVVWLYTTSCMEFSPRITYRQNFHFLANKFIFVHRNYIFMHGNFIFMHENSLSCMQIPCHNNNSFMHETFRTDNALPQCGFSAVHHCPGLNLASAM